MLKGKWVPDLRPDTPVADAARRVLALRLELTRDNLGLALGDWEREPEHVHQLRVSTRRAGAALKIFKDCLPHGVFRKAKTHIQQIRHAAGGARDWDVVLETLKEISATRRAEPRGGLDFLLGYALGHRKTAQGPLQQLAGNYPFGFERFVAETVAAVHKPRSANEVLIDVGRAQLTPLLRQLDEAAGADLSDFERLHQVRIIGKRLRYAMEIFADCFAPVLRNDLYTTVAEMQEILGDANDSYVAVQRFRSIGNLLTITLPDESKRLQPFLDEMLRFHTRRLPQQRERFLLWRRDWQQSGGKSTFLDLLSGEEPLAGDKRTAIAKDFSANCQNPQPPWVRMVETTSPPRWHLTSAGSAPATTTQ